MCVYGYLVFANLKNRSRLKLLSMSKIDDAKLLKIAEAEILGEAKRAAIRHSIAGVSGWQPCPKPNKRFLVNTLLQTLSRNRIISRKQEETKKNCKKHERKLLQKSLKQDRPNFIFQKPVKTSKHVCNSAKHKKCDKNIIKDKQKNIAKKVKNADEKHNSKKVNVII